MTPPKSPRGEARRRQAANPSHEDSSSNSEDDSLSHQNSSKNYSPRNTSDHNKYLHVSPRYDLHHRSDLNSSAETDKHTSRFNTSTSSEVDSPNKPVLRGASKSPKLYPDLEVIGECSKHSAHTAVVREASNSPKLYPSFEETEESSQEVSSNKTFILLVAVSVVVVILVALLIRIFMSSDKSAEPVDSPVPPFDRFTGHISNLQQVLPNQNKRLWRTVKASAKHVLNDTESEYPVVILMASPTKHAHIAKCIAKKIAENFELSLNLTPVGSVADIGQMQHLDPASQKQRLDEDLNSAFSSNQRKSFIIDNLQLLHPEAALMLHGYCDNDNAPFKDVMMVLLLYIDQHEVSDYSNASVEDYLEQLWSRGLEVDKVKALLSRVANNIVAIEMEDEETFSKVCS